MKRTFVAGLVFALMIALVGWMVSEIGEYPGVTRSLENPSWFMGTPASAQSGSPQEQPLETSEDSHGEYANYATFTGASEIEIGFKEYKLISNQILVEVESFPATLTFVLSNQGRFSHDFHVKGHGLDVKTPKFAPKRTHEVQVTFEQPGEYEISCPLSNHAERGMQGTLVVRQAKA